VWSFLLRLFVRFVLAVRAFHYGSSCIWVPILPIGLAFRLGAHLSNWSCISFGHPFCQLVLHFVWVPILPTGLAFREPHVYMITQFFHWNLSKHSLRICWNLRRRIFWATKGKVRRVGKRGTQMQCKARWQYGCPNA
jgi:hypothetical protein